jgi:hypothetical protein
MLLLGLALLAPKRGVASAWQSIYVVFGLILLPQALSQFVDWVASPGDSGNSLNIAWIFGVTALVGLYAGFVANIRYALLLACFAIVLSWLGLWDQLVSGHLADHTTALRWLLLAVAVLLLGLSVFASGRSSEIVTVAALAAIGAGSISVLGVFGANPFVDVPRANASFFWSLELLLVSLVAILAGAGIRARGPVYAGALGLALFTFIVGFDIAHPDSPDGTLLGWPLALLVLGVLAFAASFRGVRGTPSQA